MTIKSRIATGLATGAFALAAFAPAVSADTNINVSGNGAFSDTGVVVDRSDITAVNQPNNTQIVNNVTSHNDTGGNTASFNTGGGTVIRTGDASSSVAINNAAGLNIADVGGCPCPGDTNINVSDNGAFSDTRVRVEEDIARLLNQVNNTAIANNFTQHNNTGHNHSDFNTSPWWIDGDGNVIITGDAESVVRINNLAGANFASL